MGVQPDGHQLDVDPDRQRDPGTDPSKIREQLDSADHLADQARQYEAKASELRREAARKLEDTGWTFRDIANVTDLSFQRVGQLVGLGEVLCTWRRRRP